MGLLRFAKDETVQLPLGDEGDYIEVKSDLSKRLYNQIASIMPISAAGADLSLFDALEFQKELFKILVVGWSLNAEVSIDNYLNLSSEASNAIDKALSEHFQKLSPTNEESSKSA